MFSSRDGAMPPPPQHPTSRSLNVTQQTAVEQWTSFLRDCRCKFMEYSEFDEPAKALYAKSPLSSAALADLIWRPRPQAGLLQGPLARDIVYLQHLYKLGVVRLQSVLITMLRYSSIHKYAAADPAILLPGPTPVVRYLNSFSNEEPMLYLLTHSARDINAIAFGKEALRVMDTLAEWMQLFTTASVTFAGVLGGSPPEDTMRIEVEMTRVALLAAVIMVFENENVVRTLALASSTGIRKRLYDTVGGFIPLVDNESTALMCSRLRKVHDERLAPPTQQQPLMEEDPASAQVFDGPLAPSPTWHEHFSIPELPVQLSRAGLYIYINAALVGPPLIDDVVLFTYLHNRYGGGVQNSFVSLILASFDVLANAVFRKEGQAAAHVLRSYLVNKVPVLLSHLAPSLYATGVMPVDCITQALADVDTNAFPTLSSMFDDRRQSNVFTDSVREDFAFACCLHGLVPQESIEAILDGGTYQTLPAGGKYTQEGLGQECLADPERASRLVSELDLMDGNVGAVCMALVDAMGRLCANRETMSLKALCSQLLGNLARLDVMLLFRKPSEILRPLCELLDSITYEDDMGECQPVYEEFGAILLFVLAFVHRYGLREWDLGIVQGQDSQHSFSLHMVRSGHVGRPLSELDATEVGHVGRWLLCLSDTEAGGIPDELISACPPQDFYRLVPSLFQQLVQGVMMGQIHDDVLKAGIEYVTETFLQPSLVPAVAFLSEQLQTDSEAEQRAILKVLRLILQPKSESGEPSLLGPVLNIVAPQLETALRTHQRSRLHGNQDVQPLLQVLKSGKIVPSHRTGAADLKEAEAWASTPNGGLSAMLVQMMQAFMKWSVTPGINVMPTSYTHRQLILAREKLGSREVLDVLLSEIQAAHADPSTVGIVYDVATAIICAAEVTGGGGGLAEHDHLAGRGATGANNSHDSGAPRPPRHDLTLRDALREETLGGQRLFATDPARCEVLVRLFRRVEAQLTPAPQPTDMLAPDVAALALDMDAVVGGVPGELSDAMAAAAAADMTGVMDMDMDQIGGLDLGTIGAPVGGGAAGGEVDLAAAAAAAANLGEDGDVFLDLGPLDDWDNMDV